MKKEQIIQLFIVILATIICCIVLVKEYATAPIEITQVNWSVDSMPEGVTANEYSVPVASEESEETVSEAITVSDLEESAIIAEGDGVTYPININTATAEELDALPGIGPVLAERIITYREENNGFYDIEEIMDVSGIGESTFAKLQPYITVG